MATTVLLVRHADHGLLGRVLAGRMPGVHLSDTGRRQAEALARRLGGLGIASVQSSPRERAQETARPIADALGLAVETEAALDEIDFGAWQGRSFADLDGDPAWQRWNAQRAVAYPPDGESMRAVQERLTEHLRQLAERHADQRVVLVSHGDVIKTALLHALGQSLDRIFDIDVAPASVSTLMIDGATTTVVGLNERIAA